MSIATRIESIEKHLKESYQELYGIGFDITGYNKNLENIPRIIDNYWETLPKVTGEGTLITLDNTKEGKMKLILKGNSYQESTNGNNLARNTLEIVKANNTSGIWNKNVYTYNNVTFTYNNDGSITVNGTASANTYFYINRKGTGYESTTLDAGTYYYSCGVDGSNSTWKMQFNDDGSAHNLYGSEITKTYSESTEISFYILVYSGKNPNGATFYPMVSKTSGATYEPFTNGASPNPDFPQPIQVVTGENIVSVVGKNLLDTNVIQIYNQNKYIKTINYTTKGDIKIFANETYSIIYKTGTISDAKYYEYDKNNIQTRITSITTTTLDDYTIRTFTFSNNAKTFGFYAGGNDAYTDLDDFLSSVEIMFLKGDYSSATTILYKPFESQSYTINLASKNLFNKSTITEGKYINNNGTISTDADAFYTNYIEITPNENYCISGRTGFGYVFIYNENKEYLERSTVTEISNYELFSTNNENAKYVRFNAELDNKDVLQFEKGTEPTPYSPYFTPIELCKIGDYQDVIKKSTGKNLFDKDNALEGKRISSTTGEVTNVSNCSCSDYINVTGLSKIILSGATITYANNGAFYDKNKTYISGFNSSSIKNGIDVQSGAKYVRFSTLTVDLNTTQLEKSSQATSYEPYGTDWYIKKEIGKAVFDGSNDESWSARNTNTSGYNRFRNTDISSLIKHASSTSETFNGYCNMLKQISADNTYALQNGISNSTSGYIFVYYDGIKEYNESSFRTWLSTHNLIVYYILETPTYTAITGTLETQLNSLGFTRSYIGQTNISQDNDDEEATINATALQGE